MNGGCFITTPAPSTLRSPLEILVMGGPYRAVQAGMVVLAACSFTAAQPLMGSGAHLPLSNPVQVPQPGMPYTTSNIIHPTSFNGTWAAPVSAPWVGTFSASGPVPGNGNVGTTVYNFSSLAAGRLPIGTYFNFGDLDSGSLGGERFILKALHQGFALNLPWLNVPTYVWGAGRGPAGVPTALDMPGWSWDPFLAQYEFDGSTVTGFNPTISFTMVSNSQFNTLVVTKFSGFNGFSLSAPVIPSPGAFGLLCIAGLLVTQRRR